MKYVIPLYVRVPKPHNKPHDYLTTSHKGAKNLTTFAPSCEGEL